MIITIKAQDGKEYEAGFKFNNYALEAYGQLKATSDSLAAFTVAMFYVGYKGWCFAKQIDEHLTFEDFSDYIDGIMINDEIKNNVREISEQFTKSTAFKSIEKKNAELSVAV